ncbi:polymeric immunoglobulin receptor-like [Etheostoma cragini]|uniref:polymeric immunoglobulin receptor-like n=1 Tax=Etheostoma cragini TaxID=417921 RepID=UPI00155E0064|nr:polymeric immunoglobulin receptor-like [Etheostoma cragini]
MHLLHVLLLCFLPAVIDGDPLTPTEGSSIRVACSFSVPGRKKFLCKDECKDKDILIATEGDAAHSGRYSIFYQGGTFTVSETVVYVSITQLAKSDSGRYRCGLERAFMPDSYWPFEIRVTDAPKTSPEPMKQPEQQQRETGAAEPP